MKRLFDMLVAGPALLLLSPLLALIALAVWLEDGSRPWYRGLRTGLGGREFHMLKFRSMRPEAWKTGVSSTALGDARITRVGACLRAAKIDELPQLWNVTTGEMSLVGPRPQVPDEVKFYTLEERRLLEVRPGLTDLASIVFSDEGAILAGSADPDTFYNQVIRPWKSRLALLYLERHSPLTDLRILAWTAGSLISRAWALKRVAKLLRQWEVGEPLASVALREAPLAAYPPPGMETIFQGYRTGSR